MSPNGPQGSRINLAWQVLLDLAHAEYNLRPSHRHVNLLPNAILGLANDYFCLSLSCSAHSANRSAHSGRCWSTLMPRALSKYAQFVTPHLSSRLAAVPVTQSDSEDSRKHKVHSGDDGHCASTNVCCRSVSYILRPPLLAWSVESSKRWLDCQRDPN